MIHIMKNRDRIQKLFAVLCFIGIGILLHNCLYQVLRLKTKESRNYVASFYDVPKNKTDILIVGSSHAYCGVQPNEFWGNYGYSSYVFGSPAQTIPCSYYAIKEALTRQKPKVIFLEVYYTRFDRLYVDPGMLRFMTDAMRMGKAKHELIQDILGNKDWKVKAAFYLPFIKYHSRWNDLQPYDFYWTRWLLGGSPTSKVKKQTFYPVPDSKHDLRGMSPLIWIRSGSCVKKTKSGWYCLRPRLPKTTIQTICFHIMWHWRTMPARTGSRFYLSRNIIWQVWIMPGIFGILLI